MGRRAARGTHSTSGLVVAGDPDAETVEAARGGARGCALECGPDDPARHRDFLFHLPLFDRRLLKIFKHNFKNFAYQSCRETIGEQFL
jgi:hypothetical protein